MTYTDKSPEDVLQHVIDTTLDVNQLHDFVFALQAVANARKEERHY